MNHFYFDHLVALWTFVEYKKTAVNQLSYGPVKQNKTRKSLPPTHDISHMLLLLCRPSYTPKSLHSPQENPSETVINASGYGDPKSIFLITEHSFYEKSPVKENTLHYLLSRK